VLRSDVSLRAAREALLADPALQGLEFCRAYSAAADAQLTELLLAATGGDLQGLALLAVGGYGRNELCPHSDLDVVLVHRQRRDVAKIADSVWYPVWDEGVRLDHSVRTPAEVLAMAGADLRVQLGLLDGRIVVGDPEAGEAVLARSREVWRNRASLWLPVLSNQVALRHKTFGDVAFLLEPDLKEAHGGLRDLAGLHAAVLASPALSRTAELASLDPARNMLLAARVELHRRSPRAVDRLLLQEQDSVAEALAFRDADALMLEISKAGRAIAWASDDLWSRPALWQVTRKRRRWLGGTKNPDAANDVGNAEATGRANHTVKRGADPDAQTTRTVEEGVAISENSGGRIAGEVLLAAGADPKLDPTLGLRVAAVAAERDLQIEHRTLEELWRRLQPPQDPWPDGLRDALVRVLAAGHPAVRVLEALDHFDLMSRLLPEWEMVRNKPQRNAYHRYTVDRHLLEAAAHAASLTVRVARADLLLMAALLHDIGKGFPGDHTDAGVEIVGRIAVRMGLGPEDVRTLVSLVRNHLLLAELATRRDLDDPATIASVTSAVGDRQTLDLLAALTEADSLATGPAAWGPWKAGLVADLVYRAALVLQGGELPPPAVALLSKEHRGLMAKIRESGTAARPVVLASEPRVTVVAPDKPGLLASVTGVMSLHGLDLRSADVAGEDGVALEVFTVQPGHGRWPDWEKVSADIDEVLHGRLKLDEQLAKKAAAYDRPHPAGRNDVRVNLDNGASVSSTVLEVRAPDQVSLLHRVPSALFANELDVVAARACTLGDDIVDAFYVRDRRTGGKISDPARLSEITESVRDALVDTSPDTHDQNPSQAS
jgi:[protein-PII] uridylyltransferase